VVLTAGKDFEGEDRRAEREADWKAGHDRLAARSTQGASVVVPDAGHFIHRDDPDAVMTAIETVVDEVRRRRPAG
jgi:pimeloyl-ACP methyl ester carboxylesterase